MSEDEWTYMQSDKMTEEEKMKLLSLDWYRRIQVCFQSLCSGPLITSVHNSDSEDEEEDEADQEEQPEEDKRSQPGDIHS